MTSIAWYTFPRTGRADAFRLAEAMTRHTTEVDVHHIGRFAPLGSRHNVNHLGDGAKQPRISQAGLKRFYYFLTADDRIGDLMREQLTTDFTWAAVKKMDPRMPECGPYASASFGTDWAAYCIDWATEYQRNTGKFMSAGRGGGPVFPTQFNQVNPPAVPFPLREARGRPEAGPRRPQVCTFYGTYRSRA